MKTKFLALLLSLLCVFSATGTFAQTDKPYSALRDDSAKWVFAGVGRIFPNMVGHLIVSFSKDTLIEETNWRKFDVLSVVAWEGDTTEIPQLPLFLRLDDSAQMIYQYFPGKGEYLQYDFTLLLGDIGIYLVHDRDHGSYYNSGYRIIAKDSLVRNGAYVRYMHTGDPDAPHTWDTLWYDVINTKWLVQGLWPTPDEHMGLAALGLNCYTGTNYYYSPLGRDCGFMHPVSVPPVPKALTCVQVKKVEGAYEIVSQCQGPVNVSVYDLSGKLIHSSTARDTLRLPPLEQGIYILQMVVPSKGQQSSMKITY